VWAAVVARDRDPDQVLVRHRDDGSTVAAPVGVRLAQALHHGTDHRSQVCTALTTLGIEPPAIDVWDYAEAQGRLTETPPTIATPA
ncbi:MAG TPA: DinB family protein, partial [Candidatus Limnocylindrales bacterium]|nr:DinB family protein [Candidatus Limnocylindrales bacterium]